jgi:hypothetical protein
VVVCTHNRVDLLHAKGSLDECFVRRIPAKDELFRYRQIVVVQRFMVTRDSVFHRFSGTFSGKECYARPSLADEMVSHDVTGPSVVQPDQVVLAPVGILQHAPVQQNDWNIGLAESAQDAPINILTGWSELLRTKENSGNSLFYIGLTELFCLFSLMFSGRESVAPRKRMRRRQGRSNHASANRLKDFSLPQLWDEQPKDQSAILDAIRHVCSRAWTPDKNALLLKLLHRFDDRHPTNSELANEFRLTGQARSRTKAPRSNL